MSDSDSTSDSDISQGWTLVEAEGAADSSDRDSDIVVLKPGEAFPQLTATDPDLENQFVDDTVVPILSAEQADHVAGGESDMALAKEEGLDAKMSCVDLNLEATMQTGDAESATTMPDADSVASNKSQPDSEADAVTDKNQMHDGEERNTCQALTEGTKSVMDQGLDLADESRETDRANPDSLEQTECILTEDRHRVEATGSSQNREESMSSECLTTSSRFLPECSTSSNATEGFIQKDDRCNESDAAATDDEEDEDDAEDDDESVVRKFHEATLRSFNFQQPFGDRIEIQGNSDEEEATPPDVDDRCESDISGVADDSDSDLSSLAGIDDVQLNVGEVVRTYRHQPNPTFNFRLTLMTMTAVLVALGIGLGHYVGSTRESAIHQQQVIRMKTLQDEYFVCLRETEKLESKLARAADSVASEKISTVMAIWRKKYEELVLERADLEYRLNLMKNKVEEQESILNQKMQNCEKTLGDGDHSSRQEDFAEGLKLAQFVKTGKHEGVQVLNKPSAVENPEQEHEHEHDSEGHVLEHENVMKYDEIGRQELKIPVFKEFHDTSESEFPDLPLAVGTTCSGELTELKSDQNKKAAEINRLRNNVNQLTVENSDLKAAIQSQRYVEHPGNSKPDSRKGFTSIDQKSGFVEQSTYGEHVSG